MPRRIPIAFALLLLLALPAAALDKSSNPPPEQKQAGDKAGKLVDEGSFAIFQNGRRVATEDFTIRQLAGSSITSSHLRLSTADAAAPAAAHDAPGNLEQTSELTLLPDGSLSRYAWNQLSPLVRSAVVEADKDVLIMHSLANGKKDDSTFFLTPAAFILDDYVFSIREVLLWRYLATACQRRSSGEGCDLVRARFPVLIPLRGTSGEVYIQFAGYDDTPLNGRPQHLRHFVMQTDGADWHLWLDENQKLLRMSIPDASTEVLRQ